MAYMPNSVNLVGLAASTPVRGSSRFPLKLSSTDPKTPQTHPEDQTLADSEVAALLTYSQHRAPSALKLSSADYKTGFPLVSPSTPPRFAVSHEIGKSSITSPRRAPRNDRPYAMRRLEGFTTQILALSQILKSNLTPRRSGLRPFEPELIHRINSKTVWAPPVRT